MGDFIVFIASGLISATPVQTNQTHFATVEANQTAEQVAKADCDDFEIVEKGTVLGDTKTVRWICGSEK